MAGCDGGPEAYLVRDSSHIKPYHLTGASSLGSATKTISEYYSFTLSEEAALLEPPVVFSGPCPIDQ